VEFYCALPFLIICRAGYNVVGVDVHEEYASSLNDKTFVSREPRVGEFLGNATKFEATTDLKRGIDHSDLIYIMVDTPSNGGQRHYDVRCVEISLSRFPKIFLFV
jgi:UDPglucose 6-dehydrogenase